MRTHFSFLAISFLGCLRKSASAQEKIAAKQALPFGYRPYLSLSNDGDAICNFTCKAEGGTVPVHPEGA
jgi:hypothetical protein